MKREMSDYAKVAKIIRQGIKAMGYQCTAKSSSFSMGNSVHIRTDDIPPDVMQAIEEKYECHEYGTFDAMTDCQGYKNRDFDGPQTKYLTFNNNYSDELRQAAWNIIRAQFEGDRDEGEPPLLLSDAGSYRIAGDWASQIVYRMLSAELDNDTNWSIGREFWDKHGAQPTTKAAAKTLTRTARVKGVIRLEDGRLEFYRDGVQSGDTFLIPAGFESLEVIMEFKVTDPDKLENVWIHEGGWYAYGFDYLGRMRIRLEGCLYTETVCPSF